ncbi:MAG: biotin--[acetyl-CoA-carboxylase] ligase [Eubacteriales bacterium]
MTKEKVLRLLSPGEFVSGREIGEVLGLSRAAVWKAVQSLKTAGYEIESVTNRGYRLVGKADVLHLPEWTVLPEVDSTNNYLKQLAEAGAPHGTVVVSDCQTAGRGRLGRSFASPKGVGVYLSVLLRPEVAPGELLHLTAVAAVAGAEALEAVCGAKPGIKWTNDLIFGQKKVAGILTEMSLEAESGRVHYAIVGIGINCNQGEFPAEIEQVATSIFLETGAKVDRSEIARQIGRGILAAYDTMWQEKASWMAKYAENCVTIGREISVVRGSEARRGRALGIDEDGGLIVLYEDGTRATVNSGEVSIRGMYGYV